MRTRSLHQLTLRYTAVILAIFLPIGVSAYLLFNNFARNLEFENITHELNTKADNIAFLVGFYREVVELIAKEQGTQDLVMFASPAEAQSWATSKQKLLPQNIGLALLNRDGEILGNPLTLRIGKRCLSDLSAHIAGGDTTQPPAHVEVDGLEHFDLIVSVRDESGIVGAVFASFSLGILQRELERMLEPGLQLALYSGDNIRLAGAGQVGDQLAVVEQIIPVADTDWVLHASAAQRDYSPLWYKLVIAGIAIFLLTALVMLLFARRLSNIFALDLKAIENLLENIKDRHPARQPRVKSRLSETGNIVRSIESLAADIASYQNQLLTDSNTDDLTGLYNRRAFRQSADKCFELSRRGVNVSIVALDMDYLKAANDRFGHHVGDRLLKALAECLVDNTRSTDTVARLGGDEFVVMMVQCERSSIQAWFDKLCQAFAQRQRDILPDGADPQRACSLSAGLADISEHDRSIDDAIKRADEALYTAKGSGRGRIHTG